MAHDRDVYGKFQERLPARQAIALKLAVAIVGWSKEMECSGHHSSL